MPVDPKELHHDFVVETSELLQLAETILLNLEVSGDLDPVHALFRAVHTIKGTSAFLGFQGLSEVSHAVEAILDGYRSKRFAVNRPTIDLMLLYIDAARAFLQLLQLYGAERALQQDFTRLAEKLRATARGLDQAALPPTAAATGTGAIPPPPG
ncbi:MAG: Hpt domain-containing protein, partial [Planctomycetota bacterium]